MFCIDGQTDFCSRENSFQAHAIWNDVQRHTSLLVLLLILWVHWKHPAEQMGVLQFKKLQKQTKENSFE